MKLNFKHIVLATVGVAILAGTAILASCSKEEEIVSDKLNASEYVVNKSTVKIDRTFVDSNGNEWKVVGIITYRLIPPDIVAWDITVTDPDGNIIHFKGNSTQNAQGNIINVQGEWGVNLNPEQRDFIRQMMELILEPLFN